MAQGKPECADGRSRNAVSSWGCQRPTSERDGQRASGAGQFEITIFENLKKAGVQNTRKNERLVFYSLDPFPGTWLAADGDYTDKDGTTRRVAVSLGLEGPDSTEVEAFNFGRR